MQQVIRGGGAEVAQPGFESDPSFRGLFSAIVRQRKWFVGTLVIALAIGAVISMVLPPIYRTFTQILVEGRTQASPGATPGDLLSEITAQSANYDIFTQMEILQSSEIYMATLDRANITVQLPLTESVLERLPRLTIKQVGTSNVIQIQVDARDENHAMSVAESLPAVYMDEMRRRQADAISRALTFVDSRVTEETGKLKAAEAALMDFKRTHGVVDTENELNVRLNQNYQAEQELAMASSAAAAARANLNTMLAKRRALPDYVDQPITESNTEELKAERAKLQFLINERELLLVKYLPTHALVKQKQAEIEAQQKYVGSLENTVTNQVRVKNPEIKDYDARVADAEAALRAAEARESALQGLAMQREARLTGLQPVATDQSELERTISEAKTTLQVLNTTRNELRLKDNALRNPAIPVARPQVPRVVQPNWTLNLILAGLAGLFFGALLAITRDVVADKVNSAEEACGIARAELLAKIPLRHSQRAEVITDPSGALAFESYRLLRTNLINAAGDKGLKSFMVTSVTPGEGKSVVAANLAVAFAAEGRTVILVDANFRKPSVHRLFSVKQEPGITSALDGKSVGDVLQDTQVKGLRVLATGPIPSSPTEILGSDRMKTLHEVLVSQADVVIYDSPACSGLADTPELATVVGDVLLVVELQRPGKEPTREAVSALEFAHGRILGLAINKDRTGSARV